jgi:hypothetical protein
MKWNFKTQKPAKNGWYLVAFLDGEIFQPSPKKWFFTVAKYDGSKFIENYDYSDENITEKVEYWSEIIPPGPVPNPPQSHTADLEAVAERKPKE